MPSGSGDLGFSSWYSQLRPGADTAQSHRAPRMVTPAPSHPLNGRKSKKPPQNHHRSASFGFPVNHNPPKSSHLPTAAIPLLTHQPPAHFPHKFGMFGHTSPPKSLTLTGSSLRVGFRGPWSQTEPCPSCSPPGLVYGRVWGRLSFIGSPREVELLRPGGRNLAAHVSPTHLRGPYGVTPMIPLPAAPLIRGHGVMLPD